MHERVLEAGLGRVGAAGRVLPGHRCAAAWRTHQRVVDRGGGGVDLPDRLPVLQPVHRRQGDAAGHHPRHPGSRQQRRPGLRAHQQARAVRPPLCCHRRRRPPGRPGARRADGLPARPVVAGGRRGVRRCGAGLRGAVPVQPSQRPLARRPGARGDGPGTRHHRPVRRLPDHDHHPGRAGDGGGQGAGRKPVGHVHRHRHNAHRAHDGRVHALHPRRQDRRDLCGGVDPAAGRDLAGRQGGGGPDLGPAFTFTAKQITWMLIGYGFVASVLPVWLLLAPRDYLSTFLKIGTILALAIGILVVMPDLKMPALTQFASTGDGPVWKGGIFPFLFITIACGAVSGFHALIASGTTPKLLANEGHMRYIGYGGMLMESFVAIMALVAASIIEPGIYFAMNSPASLVGTDTVAVAAKISEWGFSITPQALEATARDIGEHSILARAGGAPTLAVGIAQILHQLLPGEDTMAFWYHFAILFEALFILTAVDAGTRAGRFMLQDLLGNFIPALKKTESWTANIIATAGCVALWGYLLYTGVIDPFGGIQTLWPLFGISNQMLAGIALMLGTVVLFKMKRDRYAWVTIVPALWLLLCTTYAGLIKIFDSNPAQGFLAQAHKFQAAIASNTITAPAKTVPQMQQIVTNAYVNTGLTVLFLFVVGSILIYSIKTIVAARRNPQRTDRETPYVALQPHQMADL
ncbi:carbon starvation protein A [Xanthomonas citri pv. aurantifolii str. ICPB 10535]|nr:carbon starvation protein A [Xanthomonas citri pv. aurantifolii str. ICPB 10535]